MTLTGEVQSKDGLEDEGTHGRVTVKVRGANSLGDHVTRRR